jgi:hypothetical protein
MARRIRISGNQLCVLVLDQEGYERAQAQGDDLLALVKSHEMKGCKSPRLCHVTRNQSHSGLGVSFNPVEGMVVHNYHNYLYIFKNLKCPCTLDSMVFIYIYIYIYIYDRVREL